MPKRIVSAGVALALVALLACSLLFLSGCSSPVPDRSGKPVVVTTLYPYYDFARQVGGDKIEVVLLIPPGVEPHEFEPRPSDITTISKATLFVYNGADLEPWVQTLIEGMGPSRPATLEAASVSSLLSVHDEGEEEDADLREGDDDDPVGAYDPHVWLDNGNAQEIVGAIATQLATLDPANAASYNKNADAYIADLAKVDAAFRAGLASCKHREFITGGHAAFGYLANRYDLKEISAYGISPNAEPSLKHISDLTTLVNSKGIKVIYFEELINPAMAQTIADEVGAKTMVLNPGHGVSRQQVEDGVTMVDILGQDLANLRIGLECK